MQDGIRRVTAAVVCALVLAGCGADERSDGSRTAQQPQQRSQPLQQPRPVAPAPPPVVADPARETARMAALGDSLGAAFALGSRLTPREVAELRQDVNAEQVATARRLGRRVSGEAEIRRLRSDGRLVALGDSTDFWVLRGMDHSVPYVTADAYAMLQELGRRFHARLDSLGLPRYRMKVTSALRTDETQADLRRINSYASRTASAHEYGTTVDVSHERFAVPAGLNAGAGSAGAAMRELEVETLEKIGDEHSRVLQAELGRAIGSMRDGGALHVMMENRQPVYHMTVARRSAVGG